MNAGLHDYIGQLLHQHLIAEDMRDAEEIYLDDLERELMAGEIVIGHDSVTQTDAEVAFYEAEDAAFDELQERLEKAGPAESADLLAAFNDRQQRWIRENFIPELAERIEHWNRNNSGEEAA
ncbi:hypothetical protein [Marinobacterium litorale]|uniref:hypothetical protein n=1 Tax=Marinobacterium litorale TaxID=404770 RepID=UPI0003FA30B0|nr:hypothetical protein [Marinobacterium litorale]